MRLWSVHPSYLDAKGLVAVWREGLLALQVLSGKTNGYTRHPQLTRFRLHPQPIDAISYYLHAIADEADQRKYHFKREKLIAYREVGKIQLTIGQLRYETEHLRKKLAIRDRTYLIRFQPQIQFEPHALFKLTDGPVESWEHVSIAAGL
jgi:hypothetical protein